jgi:zinc transporter ZupT
MSNTIDYDAIPKEELRLLRRAAYRDNTKIRLWNALISAVAVLVGLSVSKAVFPSRSDLVGEFILFVVLGVGLYAVFREAVVEPKIRRSIEKRKQPNQAPEPTPTTVTPPAGQEARQP